ncbi:MAG: glycosyltransferase [Pirellulales bacterium]|nr:glycosyltransferase [Pirellulales bacterium]
MRVLIVSAGSLGDTLPALAWAKELRARGHEAVIQGSGYYRGLFDEAGIEFEPMWDAEQHQEIVRGIQHWPHGEAADAWMNALPQTIERAYDFVLRRYKPGETLVVAQFYMFGARIANEHLGAPLVTMHLQPMVLRSVYDPVGLPRWTPRWTLRVIDRAIDLVVDRAAGPIINNFRARFGLPPQRRVLKGWCHSPQLGIGFFPDWFSPPQPDWPPNTQLVGFPIPEFDSARYDPAPVEKFLAAGDPPLVFTTSSVARGPEAYFDVAVEAARRLGRRAILLSTQTDRQATDLPPHVRQFPFVPLKSLLPRSAAHVHHAGSGSIAQSLLAGVPQLTAPHGFDQHDLSRRLERLGVSAHLRAGEFTIERVTSELARLLASPAVAERCQYYANRQRESNPIETASELLESFFATTQRAPSAAAR